MHQGDKIKQIILIKCAVRIVNTCKRIKQLKTTQVLEKSLYNLYSIKTNLSNKSVKSKLLNLKSIPSKVLK